MADYFERLVPPVWAFLISLLLVPASVIVFLPIAPIWGWITAAVLVSAMCALLYFTAPVVAIESGTLRAGRAQIPVALLGDASALSAAASYDALHTEFDVAAYYSTSPWVKSLARIPVTDAADPTSSWIISTRKPGQLAAALHAAQQASVSNA